MRVCQTDRGDAQRWAERGAGRGDARASQDGAPKHNTLAAAPRGRAAITILWLIIVWPGRRDANPARLRERARSRSRLTTTAPKTKTLAAAPHAARSHLRMKAAPQAAACSSCRVCGAGDGRRAGESQGARARNTKFISLSPSPPPFQRRKSRPPQLTSASTRKTTSKVVECGEGKPIDELPQKTQQ